MNKKVEGINQKLIDTSPDRIKDTVRQKVKLLSGKFDEVERSQKKSLLSQFFDEIIILDTCEAKLVIKKASKPYELADNEENGSSNVRSGGTTRT